MSLSDLELRKKELEQDAYLHFAQHKHHTAEAARHDRELAEVLIRINEIDLSLRRESAAKPSMGNANKAPEPTVSTPKSSAYQRFRSEGPTAVIVRLLYENKEGMTTFEMQARNGIAIRARIIRKIVGRLVAAGFAKQEGKKVILTEQGINSWEASPLFLHSRREGHSRASQN